MDEKPLWRPDKGLSAKVCSATIWKEDEGGSVTNAQDKGGDYKAATKVFLEKSGGGSSNAPTVGWRIAMAIGWEKWERVKENWVMEGNRGENYFLLTIFCPGKTFGYMLTRIKKIKKKQQEDAFKFLF